MFPRLFTFSHLGGCAGFLRGGAPGACSVRALGVIKHPEPDVVLLLSLLMWLFHPGTKFSSSSVLCNVSCVCTYAHADGHLLQGVASVGVRPKLLS